MLVQSITVAVWLSYCIHCLAAYASGTEHIHWSRCPQVDFEAVPDLVAGRKVFLLDGQAYVSKTDIVSLVVGHFRCSLTFAAGPYSSLICPGPQ